MTDLEQRNYKVRRAILKALTDPPGILMPENVLHGDLALHVVPAPLLSEFRAGIAYLEENGFVAVIYGAMGGARKIRLTDVGRSACAEMQ